DCNGIVQATLMVAPSACTGSSMAARTTSTSVVTGTGGEEQPEFDVSLIAIYPNPSKGIAYTKNDPKDALIEVYNQSGQRVAAGVVENGAAEIDLVQHVNGIYVVRISLSGKA